MRIGHITGEYPPMQGGIADYTAILCAEMARQGHEIFVLTSQQATGAPSAEGVRVFPQITNWNRAAWRQISAWVRQHKLDVVNLQYQTAAYNMAAAIHFMPAWLPAPVVTTFHDLRFPYLFPKAGVLRPWIVNQLARRSAGCLVTNRGDEAALRQRVNPAHLAQIPLGATVGRGGGAMSPERVAEVRRQIAGDDAAFIVAHFGFVNASKGVDTLLQAAAQAQAEGVPLTILMMGERAGSSDPTNFAYGQTIDALAAELGLSPYWTGFLRDADVPLYFAAADAVALPFKDGASLRRTSLQAALINARPILTTAPSDDPLPEFIDGEHLLYVPIDDAAALAAGLTRLYRETPLRQQLAAGAAQAAQYFDWGRIGTQILDFYARVTNHT